MNRRLISVGLVILALGVTKVNAAPYYKIVCVSGNDMQAKFTRSKNSHLISLIFKRAPKGVSQQMPKDGECAWMDRGVSANEPNIIFFKTENTIRTIMPILIKQKNITIDWVHIDKTLGPHKLIKNLIKMVQSRSMFTLEVRNENEEYVGRVFKIKKNSFKNVWTDHRN